MSFQPLPVSDPKLAPLTEIQDRIKGELERLEEEKLSNRVLVVTTLTTAAKKVRHGLGYPVTTWEVVRKNANAVVYESGTVTDPTQDISLIASATVTVTLRFT